MSTSYSGICIAICTNTSTDQEQRWVLGDASFAPTGEKSQQGLIVYHGITSNQKKCGNLVQWRSSRQDLIAKSSCEAELIASSEALQQGENIAIVVAEMTNKSCEIEVLSDNTASLHMIRNGSETAWRTRHIRVKALWMHQMARRGLKFTYQPTAEMAADSQRALVPAIWQQTTKNSRRSLSHRRLVCHGLAQCGFIHLVFHWLTENLNLNKIRENCA